MQKHPSNLGKWLKRRRKALSLTQQQLALLAGCSRLLISEVENGHGNPRLDNLLSILHVLGLQLAIEEGKDTLILRLDV